jgi:hypothetical protein
MRLHGATLTPLNDDMAKRLVAWVLDRKGDCPLASFSPQWAVLQCDGTLVWGIRHSSDWRWAHEVDKGIRYPPSLGTLREARIFGRDAEALVWRAGGRLAGRLLADDPAVSEELKPIERKLVFEGDEEDEGTLAHGFIKHVTGGGRIVVAPGRKLVTREYLADVEDPYVADANDTGLLRIAATRFVEVK